MGRIDWLSAFRGRVAGSNLQRRAKPRRPLNSKLAAWPQVEVFEPRVLMSIDSPFDESFPTGPQPLDVATGFVDANGSLDAIVLRTDGQLVVALNDGSGMWSSVVTTDLSVPGALGLASERFDGDTFQDVAVQGPDSFVIARGDGFGGFAVSHSWTAPVAGSLSPSDGRRVGIAAEMLNSDFAVDLLTVLPGSDQGQNVSSTKHPMP